MSIGIWLIVVGLGSGLVEERYEWRFDFEACERQAMISTVEARRIIPDAHPMIAEAYCVEGQEPHIGDVAPRRGVQL